MKDFCEVVKLVAAGQSFPKQAPYLVQSLVYHQDQTEPGKCKWDLEDIL